MNAERKDGGPAFPEVFSTFDAERSTLTDVYSAGGMSVHDVAVIQFAAAMASIAWWAKDDEWPEIIRRANVGADAFIAQRERSK